MATSIAFKRIKAVDLVEDCSGNMKKAPQQLGNFHMIRDEKLDSAACSLGTFFFPEL